MAGSGGSGEGVSGNAPAAAAAAVWTPLYRHVAGALGEFGAAPPSLLGAVEWHLPRATAAALGDGAGEGPSLRELLRDDLAFALAVDRRQVAVAADGSTVTLLPAARGDGGDGSGSGTTFHPKKAPWRSSADYWGGRRTERGCPPACLSRTLHDKVRNRFLRS